MKTPNLGYLLSRQPQTFQEALMSLRVLPLEQSVPVLHRRFIQADCRRVKEKS
jgi:hypothetical protein